MPTEVGQGICPACLLREGLSPAWVPPRGEATLGFDSTETGHVLETLERSIGPVPRVLLPDTALDEAGMPVIKPSSDAMPPTGDRGDRYQLFGEIARGGMGAVLKGRDTDLGRDLAVKVLLERHQGAPEMVRRFVEEAQIGGQLQHPGIVPVYELGTFGDRRPYFTMKLVKGRTLASLLAERKQRADPTVVGAGSVRRSDRGTEPPPIEVLADLPRFLSIFESICQTVAYAHARGVIHRDLKPSNVMVGNFGEVQVMDWGLAKVLKQGGVADEGPVPEQPAVSVIATVRSGSDVDESTAGTALGTPAYMSPEQASGEVERVDRRADVFGLGSILCEILTGIPAYTGRSPQELMKKAMRGDTEDAQARLDACGADPELVTLAKGWLACEPEDRPNSAGAVAERLSAYLAGVQDRLRAAEIAGAEADARADEERKRRRLTVALAASLVSTAALVGGGWAWIATQRAERATVTGREVNQALAEAAELRGRAKATRGGDPALLDLSVAEAKRGSSLLALDEGDPELRNRVRAFLADVTRERDESKARAADAERDRQMVDRLDQIKLEYSSHTDRPKIDAHYVVAFREFGIDVDALAPAEAGARVASSRIADELISAIDQWIFRRKSIISPDLPAVKRLIAVADAADSDPWRRRLRDALGRDDRETLRQLAATADVDHLTTENTSRLAFALTHGGDAETSVVLMRAVVRRHRDDFWLNYDLVEGLLVMKPPRVDEALQYATAEAALRPRSWIALDHLGTVLNMQGRHDEAIAAFRESTQVNPDNALAHQFFGDALKGHGRRDEAIAEYREAARLDAERGRAGSAIDALGKTLREFGRPDETVAIYRQILGKSPRDTAAHLGLANELRALGRHNEAVAEFREAIRLKPGDAAPHTDLGHALMDEGKPGEAVAEFREAIRLKPGDASTHYYLGNALKAQGRREEAIAGYREAARLDAEWGHVGSAIGALGSSLRELGLPDETVAIYRQILGKSPRDAAARFGLIKELTAQGRHDEVVAEYREAIRLAPGDAAAQTNLGIFQRFQGNFDGAIAAYREAIRLKPDLVIAHNNLAEALTMHPDPAKREPALALEHARKATALEPRNQEFVNTLAMAEYRAGLRDLALASFRKSMELANGGDPQDWFFVAMIEHQRGNAEEAAKWFDKSVAWMKGQRSSDAELLPKWTEAAKLLGRAGPKGLDQENGPDLKAKP
jgi:tetratricopeptide (TPR) repeat protein/serine/threonine protein kinase